MTVSAFSSVDDVVVVVFLLVFVAVVVTVKAPQDPRLVLDKDTSRPTDRRIRKRVFATRENILLRLRLDPAGSG